ncbi:MAG: hypothetical protein NTU44_01330 [Bacteroidetes bacterium]|nr:hypothetical protein [Bacteroidota bacterium]
MKPTNPKPYKTPEFNIVTIDKEISLVMMTLPPGDPPGGARPSNEPDKKKDDAFSSPFD